MAVYLRPDTVLQPLVDRWYAWSHLVAPVTLAFNHLERHLKIMDSYVAAPHVHAAAIGERGLVGGPFLDLKGRRADDVAALAATIRERRGPLLELAKAVRELSTTLAAEATGHSIEPFYARVPDALRGYVELGYDLHNRPHVRLLEPLLYASKYYDPTAQSVELFTMQGDRRPFVLSTPSLDEADRVHVARPFAAPEIDLLTGLRWHPRPFGEIREALGLDDLQAKQLAEMTTDQAPQPPAPRYDGPGVRWRYFGHACVLVESGGVSVLTDPLVAYHHGGALERYTIYDLPDVIDCALVTHGHQDHVMLETLLQLRDRIRTVVVPRASGGSLQDPSLRLVLQQAGFRNVVEMQELDTIDLGPLVVRGVPFLGEHSDLDIRAKITYLVEGAGHRLYFAGDTRNVDTAFYDHVRDAVGDVDTVFIGMECEGAPLSWLYGPLMMAPRTRETYAMEQSRRLSGSDFTRAVDLVRSLRAQRAFVYSMGLEPWLGFLVAIEYTPESTPIVESDKFVAWCREQGIETDRLYGCAEQVLT